MIRAWHFVRIVNGQPQLRDGSPLPAVGEWLVHKGRVELCASGLHASRRALDALGYVSGSDLGVCLVDVEGDVKEWGDKLCGRRRRILSYAGPIDHVPREFARAQARSALHLWDAPAVVREYLETGREEIRVAAGAAAWDAAWDAARDAARAAARAAGAAAGAAARAAARAAAWAAAWDAARDDLEARLLAAMPTPLPSEPPTQRQRTAKRRRP